MQKKFFKSTKNKTASDVDFSFDTLIKNLEATKYEIADLDATLDYVTDPILLNQIIFQRKAAEMRYRYWYKLAREMKTSPQP